MNGVVYEVYKRSILSNVVDYGTGQGKLPGDHYFRWISKKG